MRKVYGLDVLAGPSEEVLKRPMMACYVEGLVSRLAIGNM